jgi:DNA-binding IclR family transcriptional regulator
MKDNKSYEVPAIARALDIMEMLNKDKEASFTEIFTALGLPKSSTYNIIYTLESRGYIRRIGKDGKYVLGLRLYELGNTAVAATKSDLRREARDVLQELAAITNQPCHLGVLDGIEGVYLDKVEGSRHIVIRSSIGKRLSLHCTAIGKALLAWHDQTDLLLSKIVLQKCTKNTIVDIEELKRNLVVIKEKGYALDDEENEPDVRCIAMPVWDITGKVVAAISLSGLTNHITAERLPWLVEELKKATEILSSRLGGDAGSRPERLPAF